MNKFFIFIFHHLQQALFDKWIPVALVKLVEKSWLLEPYCKFNFTGWLNGSQTALPEAG
jgi:hypothetical protein